MTKKTYEPPRILFTESLAGRAVTCAHGDEACRVQGGPIGS